MGHIRRHRILLGFVIAFVLASILIVIVFERVLASRTTPPPPTLAGQYLPAQLLSIDFSKHYDIVVRVGEQAQVACRNCEIIGFTGKQEHATLSSPEYRSFDHWLVLQHPDQRRVYLDPDYIIRLEESAILVP